MEDKIGIVGLGYIGLPLLAALANVGYKVMGVDINQDKLQRLMQDYEADIYEPGLNETLKQCRSRIEFTSSLKCLLTECNTIMITISTPLAEEGTLNLSQINDVITEIGKGLRKEQVIILKSTLLPGTTKQIALKLQEISGLEAGRDFYVAFCPERTVEGISLHELRTLPKIIGGISIVSTDRAARIVERLGGRIIRVSCPEVAEVCKLIDNAYRALNIAFANEIGEICEKIGIDAYEAAYASNEYYDRTNLFRAALGAGGPCLSKDPEALARFANDLGVDGKVINSVITKNKESTLRVALVISSFLKEKRVKKPIISLIGLTFKGFPETDDVRNSPTIIIYSALRNRFKGAEFKFYDPIVKNFLNNSVCQTLEEAIKDSNVVAFLVNNRALVGIDADFVLNNASRPLMVVDCWHNIANAERIKREKKAQIFRIGDGRL